MTDTLCVTTADDQESSIGAMSEGESNGSTPGLNLDGCTSVGIALHIVR